MPTISISKEHSLARRDARDAVERIARDLHRRFDLAWAWDGDEVRFQRAGLSGRMRLDATEIRLDVKLGGLLAMLKPALEREIHAQLDALTATREG